LDVEKEQKQSVIAGQLSGAKQAAFPSYFPPMLASLAEKPFDRKGWIFEPKMDGMRCIAFVNADGVKLLSRRGQNITAQYPALVAALPSLCKCPMVLDGEIIALNEQGRPSFQLLQQRMNLSKVADISRADARIPVQYFVFDAIHAGNQNISRCSLADRKAILQENLQQGSGVSIISYFENEGIMPYQACVENGFEGIVAKRKDSPYETGKRSPYWIKVKAQKSSEFVIGGYSQGQGSRSNTFGSLVLGYYNDEQKLVYAGSVGSGFDERLLADMMRRMSPLKISSCPFLKKPEDKKDATWLQPELVAEIKFMDWTDDMHLRNPVFLHLRHDIQATDVRIITAIANEELAQDSVERNDLADLAQETVSNVQMVASVGTPLPSTRSGSPTDPHRSCVTSDHVPSTDLDLEIAHWQKESQAVIAQLGGREKNMQLTVDHETISLTNLDKILFPATDQFPAINKREYLKLIAFLSPYLLAHLEHRVLTMIRAPSGMRSRSFYQKHWNLDIPDFIESVRVDPTDPTRKDQLLCNNLAALIFLAQHNILEYHCWLSRLRPLNQRKATPDGQIDFSDLEYPEFMVFDIDIHQENEKEGDGIDPKAFNLAREVALKLREILQQIKLNSYLKTSGRNGLHVFIPVERDLKFDEVRVLAETIAAHAEGLYPNLISLNSVVARKTSRVFLDYLANAKGRSIAAAYSSRLTPEATISTPIHWDELEKISPRDFNQHTIRNRISSTGDIWKDILKHKEDLSKRLGKS
jgi:bifunctional non-homologous end joining protein LigD